MLPMQQLTQVIKAYEPVFTFALLSCLHAKSNIFNFTILISLIIMSLGASLFVASDSSLNVWGVGAAMVSNTAFSVRNIYLKKLSDAHVGPLHSYAVVSVCGGLFLLPLMVVKLAMARKMSLLRLDKNIFSAVFHFAYNVASVNVLQNISPLSHAILNVSKRLFVIVSNLLYFPTTLSWKMLIGLLLFTLGLFLYQMTTQRTKFNFPLRKIVVSITMASLICTPIIITNIPFTGGRMHMREIPPTSCQQLTTAWVFDRPIPLEVVQNIKAIHAQNPNAAITVYCGTSHCMRAIKEMDSTKISGQFLVVSDLVINTPLMEWCARHYFNKILAGAQFEDHLHDAVQLALLWHYGGLYFSLPLLLTCLQFHPAMQKLG